MEYATSHTPLGAYLIAAQKLRFLRVEAKDPSTAFIVFADPDGQGRKLDAAFRAGEDAVSASAFFQYKRLRTLIENTLKVARVGAQ